MNRKLYLQAVERDVHFEIQYTEILNPEQRKAAINNAHLFYVYGKSKVSYIYIFFFVFFLYVKIN